MLNIKLNKNPISSFFSKPIVGILGSIFSIIALPLSVYFYIESIQSPNLTFSRNPSKLEIVTASASKSSKFSVDYNGQPVSGDISIAQIAIWNQGNKPIKAEDMLAPVILHTTTPGVDILEASVGKTSRKAIEFKIQTNQLQEKQIPVTWKILEQGDGGVIEIIYVGAPDANFDVKGEIVGQKDIGITQYSNEIGFQSPDEEFETRRKFNKWRQYYFLPFALATFIGFVFTLFKIVKGGNNSDSAFDSRITKGMLLLLAVSLLVMTFLSVSIYILSLYPIPPPGL
jgi:hypothetical protein